jgi:hypothetical protein
VLFLNYPTSMDELRHLAAELGNPGIERLWLAARRAGLDVTKKQVTALVRKRGEKQVFQPLQPAKGKTVAGGADTTYHMDLVDLKNSPGIQESATFKFFLVLVNVFDRTTYTRNLRTKGQEEVRSALASIIASLPANTIRVIASDGGSEFTGPVADMLFEKDIAHRPKAPGDVNALSVVDRTIQSLKKKLAELSSTSKRTWPDLLQQAVSALNRTPKPKVLHGDSPEEVKDDPQVQFMLQQDQAKNFRHNAKLTERQRARLESDGAFRAPLPGSTNKFKRSFRATYGEVLRPQDVRGGIVTATDGSRHSLKQIRTVPVDSSRVDPSFGADTAGPARKRAKDAPILDVLAELLQGRVSLTKAAQLLRSRFNADGRDYDLVLKATRASLIELIRLDDRFKLTGKAGGDGWYYVALV